MPQVDEATRARAFDAVAMRPDELTPEERTRSTKIAYEVAELRSAPPETLSPALREEFSRPRQYGFVNEVPPPLPPERDTRFRKMWDEIHIFVLHTHAKIEWFQHKINQVLRENAEWEPFNVLCFLNHVSEHLTGKHRFMMMEQFTQSKEQQDAQLYFLHARKPAVHDELLHILLHAIEVTPLRKARLLTARLVLAPTTLTFQG